MTNHLFDKKLAKIPSFIAYYRLSYPKRDKITGEIIKDPYGIDAQKKTIETFVEANGGVLIQEYTEMKSGNYKNRTKRPKIHQAVATAKSLRATLLFAYVDRIARDVEFTANLQNSGVKFICCDMPNANEFSINIMASMAQEYSRSISEKILRSFEVKRRRGDKFGCVLHKDPGCKLTPKARAIAAQNKKDAAARNPNNMKGASKAFALHLQGYTCDQIAFVMNNLGFKSPSGKKIVNGTVRRWIQPHIEEAQELRDSLPHWSMEADNKPHHH